MNNLKRILSLALASVMVIGMMVVGASAKEFTDDETIANTDAVDTLVALNVIGGYDDGSFRPEGNVTRAQMAKMIAVALHGGDEDFRGSSSGSQFTDVKDGMWYTKFINYCAGEGIINGRNATTFDPEGNVTATETAVMIMRAMGYRNETFLNEKGVYSPAAVDKLAETLGLYDDTTSLTDTSVALNRQNAAQVICNAIQLPTPVYRMTYNSEGVRTWSLESTDGKTVLENAYKANIEYGILKNTEWDAEKGTYTYTIDSTAEKVAPLQGTKGEDGKMTGKADAKVTTKADASALFMQRVKVVYSGNLVLSVTPAGNNVLADGVWAGMNTKTEGKIDGYTLADKVTKDSAVEFNGTKATPNDYDNYTLIDNDGDNKIDAIVVYPVVVETVTSVKKGQVKTDKATYIIADDDAKKINAVTADELAEDDVIQVVKAAKLPSKLVKLSAVEDVTATVESADKTVVTIGGVKYNKNGKTVNLGTAYDVVAVNGYIFAIAPHDNSTNVAADINKTVYVTGFAEKAEPAKDALGNASKTDYSQKVELLFTDGTKSIVNMVNLGVYTKAEADADATGATKEGAAKPVSGTNIINAEGLYSYTEKDGEYSLVEMDKTSLEDAKYEGTDDTAAIKDGKQGSVRFNADAVMFVKYSTNGKTTKVDVLSGADVNAWPSSTDTLTASLLYSKANANGFKYVELGLIDLGTNNLPGAVATEDMFGYLTANTVNAWNSAANDGKGASQMQVTLWDGETNDSYFVNVKDADATKLVAGTMVRYQLTDNVVTKLEIIPTTTAAAIEAYDEVNIIILKDNKTEYDLSKATVLYIDPEDTTGSETGTIRLAGKDEDGNTVNNVYAVIKEVKDGEKTKKVLEALYVVAGNAIEEAGESAHVHKFEKVEAKAANCVEKGNKEYYHCTAAGCPDAAKKYSDADGKTELADWEIAVDASVHKTTPTWTTVAEAAGDSSYTAGDHILQCPDCKAVTNHHTKDEHTAGKDGCTIGD